MAPAATELLGGRGAQRRPDRRRAALRPHRFDSQCRRRRRASEPASVRPRAMATAKWVTIGAWSLNSWPATGDEHHRKNTATSECRGGRCSGDFARARALPLCARVTLARAFAHYRFEHEPPHCRPACRRPAPPPSDMMFSDRSDMFISMKVPTTETGMATLVMNVVRASRKNR